MTNNKKNPSRVLNTVRTFLAGFDAGALVRHGAEVPKNHPSRRRP
ncbi:hypothetical protein [Nocardioides sp. NPDC006273]